MLAPIAVGVLLLTLAKNIEYKCRLLQYHLSTALVVMLIVGLLMGANMKPQFTSMRLTKLNNQPTGTYSHFEYGWPITACELVVSGDFNYSNYRWVNDAVVFDVVVALVIALMVVALLEHIIPRKERRTKPPGSSRKSAG